MSYECETLTDEIQWLFIEREAPKLIPLGRLRLPILEQGTLRAGMLRNFDRTGIVYSHREVEKSQNMLLNRTRIDIQQFERAILHVAESERNVNGRRPT